MSVYAQEIAPLSERIHLTHEASRLPSTRNMQRVLLVATTALAILSLIPPLRFGASLALRSVAVVSSAVNTFDSLSHEGWLGRVASISKIAIVILGLTACIIASPVYLIASLAADIAYQIFEAARAFSQKEWGKGICHLSIIAIDTLLLAGIAAASWELMVSAAAVSSVVMIVMLAKCGHECAQKQDCTPGDAALEMFCYTVLLGVGIAGAVSSAKLTRQIKTDAHFKITNNCDDEMRVYDRNGNVIATIAPHSTQEMTVPVKDLVYNEYVRTRHPYSNPQVVYPTKIDRVTEVFQQPIAPKDFPTLPLGGTAIVTRDHR